MAPNYAHKLTRPRSLAWACRPARASRQPQVRSRRVSVCRGGWRAAVRSAWRGPRSLEWALGGKNQQRCRQFLVAGCESVSCALLARRHPCKWRPYALSRSVARQRAMVRLPWTQHLLMWSAAAKRRPRAGARSRVLPVRWPARCLASARCRPLPHVAGKFSSAAPVATTRTITLRCTSARAGTRVASWRSIFVDARAQAASGRPRETRSSGVAHARDPSG